MTPVRNVGKDKNLRTVKLNIIDSFHSINCALWNKMVSSLSFTSLGVNLDERYANNNIGQFTFRIHGSIYHRIGSLFPNKNEIPKFAQLYVFDTDYELDNRMKNFTNLKTDLIRQLQSLMHIIIHM